MRILPKNKKGFTLVEMVLVIGIIVILAAVVLIGISSYLSQAKSVASEFSQEQQSFSDNNKQINENFIDLGY